MSSGDTLRRMELLITKSGPRIPRNDLTRFLLIVILIDLVKSVGDSLKNMLSSFYNDLVQG